MKLGASSHGQPRIASMKTVVSTTSGGEVRKLELTLVLILSGKRSTSEEGLNSSPQLASRLLQP